MYNLGCTAGGSGRLIEVPVTALPLLFTEANSFDEQQKKAIIADAIEIAKQFIKRILILCS